MTIQAEAQDMRAGEAAPAEPHAPQRPSQKMVRKAPQGTALLDRPLLLLVVVGGFLGLSTLFAKAAPAFGWHQLALLQWSMLGGAAGLFAVTRLRYRARSPQAHGAVQRHHAPLRSILVFTLISGLLFIAPNMIAVVAAPKVGAGFVSLCYAFPLVLTYAFAVILGLQRLQFLMGAGVLSGLAGGLLLALSGAELSAEASLWSALALLIPFFLAAGNIFRTLKWPQGAKPVDLALGMMAVGVAVLMVFTSLWHIPVLPSHWSAEAAALLAAQTLIFSLQYGLYFRLQQSAGPVYLSQIGSVAAVFGLALGYLVFNEVPNGAKLAAVAFVGLGIVLVTLGQRRSQGRGNGRA